MARAIPVIIGVGEVTDRSPLASALDPAGLAARALQVAERDAGRPLRAAIGRVDIINEISWPYPDPVAAFTSRIGRPDVAAFYHPVGGQTPLLAIHEAALAIQAGDIEMAAIVGAEAEATVRRARREGSPLPWPPRDEHHRPVRGGDFQSLPARALELTSPVNVYPLYENATRRAWNQDFVEAQDESAALWARNAATAATRPTAWLRDPVTPDDIVADRRDNRLIAWPYRKLMVANPIVNQGAAVIVASTDEARRLGIAEDRWIYFAGGSAADEQRDILKRPDYVSSRAMAAVLDDARALAPHGFDAVELYSCFPCVPKMARRHLGLDARDATSVAGGLTFFGAPLNNYMTHAVVAMVEKLRAEGGTGLLYGQGEYVTKHHELVLDHLPPADPLPTRFRRTDIEADLAAAAPTLASDYRGTARIETHTTLFDRDQRVRHGVAILRTADDARLAARVPAGDERTIAAMTSHEDIVGRWGMVSGAGDDVPTFALTG